MRDEKKTKDELIQDLGKPRRKVYDAAPDRRDSDNSLPDPARTDPRWSDELYRQLVESINDVIYMANIEGIVTYVSPVVEKLIGYRPGEIVGHHYSLFIHPEDRAMMADHFKAAIFGVTTNPEFRMVARNGSLVYVRASSRRRFEKGVSVGLVGTVTDITERKRAQSALKQSEETTRALLNAARSAAFLLDLEGTVLAANKVAANSLQKSVAEIRGKRLADLLPPEMSRECVDRGRKVIDSGKAEYFDAETGDRIYNTVIYPVLEETGKVVELAIYSKDVTDIQRTEEELREHRKYLEETVRARTRELEDSNKRLTEEIQKTRRVEAALLQKEEKFRKIFNIIPVAAAIIGIRDGRCVEVNSAFAEITGFDKAEALGRTLTELGILDDSEGLRSLSSFLLHKKELRDIELSFFHKNATKRTGLMSSTTINLGSVKYALSALIDITERKHTEELLALQRDLGVKLNSLNSSEPSMEATLESCLMIPELDCGGLLRIAPGDPPKAELTFRKGLTSSFPDSFDRGFSAAIFTGSPVETRPLYWSESELAEALGRPGADEGLKSMALLPIKPDENSITFLLVASRSSDRFATRTKNALESFVTQLNDAFVRIKAQEQVVEQKRSLATLLESSMDSIVIVDRSRHIEDCNSSFLAQFGYERSEVIGRSIEMVHKDKKAYDDFGERITPIIVNGGYWRGEWEYRKKNGDIVPMELVISLMKKSDLQQERFLAVMRDIERRKASEKKLLDYQTQLKNLASELSLFEEREHRRIASHLHDGLVQTLVFSKLKLEELAEDLQSEPYQTDLAQILNLLDMSIEECRSLVYELSPPVLYELGIAAGLRWLADHFEDQHGLVIGFHHDKSIPKLPDNVSGVLFRAAKELLTNIVKHSGAKNAFLEIRKEKELIVLSVRDDGRGFDAGKNPECSTRSIGFGLFNLRERVESIDGTLTIVSSPGAGASVTISVKTETDDAAS